ncbi:Ff.00g042130.m01.CDS01 [Fusarium sp. VM40]|nr:Ff.00g042130.m01.CDS01 [Fusarium sp. VM40]
MANWMPCIVGWLFIATLFIGCMAADDGDDFSNNLFSDLAPLLALFGERVTMQFMSQSMGWADNIILAMAPFGIITAIVGAIRVGGPPSLKAVIGRARENLAVSETELMSSTSKEVCEVWNGREVSNHQAAPTIEVLKLDQAIDKGYITDCDGTKESKKATTAGTTTGSAQDAETKENITQPSGSRNPIGDEEQANSRRNPNPEIHPQASSPSTEGPVPSVSNSTRKPQKICIIRDVSGDSPNILLNCHPPANERELWAFAAIGTCLQLGVLIYSGLATYHPALQFKKDDKPVEAYAYPCTAVGTLVLVLGMLLCGHVVESSTDEKRYEPAKEWTARMIWLQQTKTVSDQVFDSHMVYAQDDRQTIITSRRSERHGNRQSTAGTTGGHSAEDDDPSAALQFITICGAAVALCGFVVQFVGLRGMHWSASIAQLGAVLVMVCIKAWVRRGLARSPACKPLASGFELDWFAKQLGSIHQETWSRTQSKRSDLVDIKTSGSASSLDNKWTVVTGGKSSLGPPEQMQAHTPALGDNSIFDAQTVLDARKQLARLADWRGPASREAVCLARAIECTMNALSICLPKESKSFIWNIETRYIGSQEQPISIRLSQQAGVWKVDATDMEATLSLWLSSVDEEENLTQPEPLNSGVSDFDDGKSHSEPKIGDDQWLRTKGTTAKQSLRLLGKQTPSMSRDLQWWIARDLLSILQVREDEVASLRTTLRVGKHRVVGYDQYEEGSTNQLSVLQYLDVSNSGFDNDDYNGNTNDGYEIEGDCNTDDPDDDNGDSGDKHPADYYDGKSVSDFENEDVVDDAKNDDNDNQAENLGLLGSESHQPLMALFAMDLYSTFMRAMAKAMTIPIPGGADEIQADSNTNGTSWKTFTLRNSHLSKMIQDVHSTGLGSLDQIYLSVITPLSQEKKLPKVDAVVNLAVKNSRRNEESQKWQEAGDDLIWLFRLANRTFPKESDVVAKATANLMEYQRLANLVLRLATGRELMSLGIFDDGNDTIVLKMLKSNLQRELKDVDPTVERQLLKKYKILGPSKFLGCTYAHKEAESLLHKATTIRNDPRDILERTATHYAGVCGSVTDFENYVTGQYDIGAQDLLGRTALHYACFCSRGRLKVVQSLIGRGAELDTRARDGATPLHYAAMKGYKGKAKLLIESGATIDIWDLAGRSPLHTAAVHGRVTVVEYLWDKAKQELRDRSGWTVLHLAAMSGSELVVQFLVNLEIDKEAKDRNGRTALQLAAMAGKKDVVKLLIDHGADTKAKDNRDRDTLHLAAMAGEKDVVKFLIDRGFDKEVMDAYAMRPLDQAACFKHKAVVRLLS